MQRIYFDVESKNFCVMIVGGGRKFFVSIRRIENFNVQVNNCITKKNDLDEIIGRSKLAIQQNQFNDKLSLKVNFEKFDKFASPSHKNSLKTRTCCLD